MKYVLLGAILVFTGCAGMGYSDFKESYADAKQIYRDTKFVVYEITDEINATKHGIR